MGLLDRLRSRKRVAVLGIDGVPSGLLRTGIAEGWLENLGQLSTFHDMRAELPVVSSVCWPSATTGLNPGRTGVYGFQDRNEGTDDLYIPLSGNVEGKRLWDVAGDAGKSSLVLNVPVTFPPEDVKGTMVSGFLAPDVESACSSPSTAERLNEMGYRVDVDVSLHDQKDALMEDIHDVLDTRLRAFRTLAEEEKWDLFFGVIMETDRLNHFFWRDYAEEGDRYDDFVEVYRKIDRFVGEFRDSLPDGTELIVMSDHGFTSLEKEFDLNAWLQSEGYLDSREREDDGSLDGVRGRAYSMTPGRVYVDLESRRPGGSVDDGDYDEVREGLTDDLLAAEDPETGERVVADVYTREELYDGPHLDSAPDLVAHPVDGYDLKGSFDGGDMVRRGPRTGMHTLSDASLLSTADLEGDASVGDVFSTVLDLLDVEHGPVDGASLVK